MVPERLRRYYFSPLPKLVFKSVSLNRITRPLRQQSPQQVVARLTTRNNQPITVNGLSANTGATILTGATIETGADTSATVNLGPLGTLDIAPNTKLILTYDDDGNVKALIIFGCAVLTAKEKTKGEVATEQGKSEKNDPAAGGVLRMCGPGASANESVKRRRRRSIRAWKSSDDRDLCGSGCGGVDAFVLPGQSQRIDSVTNKTFRIVSVGAALRGRPFVVSNSPGAATAGRPYK